jgi:hypothetical protein
MAAELTTTKLNAESHLLLVNIVSDPSLDEAELTGYHRINLSSAYLTSSSAATSRPAKDMSNERGNIFSPP